MPVSINMKQLNTALIVHLIWITHNMTNKIVLLKYCHVGIGVATHNMEEGSEDMVIIFMIHYVMTPCVLLH